MVSSMVDDVFFISRKSVSRAITSRSVPCVCAVVSLMNTLLTNDYASSLHKSLSTGASTFVQASMSKGEEDSKRFGVSLNNLQVSLSYMKKLKAELEQRIDTTFQVSNEKEIALSPLQDLAALILNMERILASKVGNVCDALITQLVPCLQEIANMKYLLDERTYEDLTETETWAHRILVYVQRFSSSLEATLTSENRTQVLDHMLQVLASRCEAYFMQKPFNQLGGLQFDRDIRLLVTHFSEIYQSSVREKFARLTQMATILCFETVEEMLDYWGEEGGSINWRLSPAEIKTILKLRQDFSETNISALLL